MLNKDEIQQYIKEKGLVANYIHLETQLTPNGFDLTVAKVFSFDSQGALDFSNKERNVPDCIEILPQKLDKEDKFGTSTMLSTDGERSRTIGWWELKKGAYKIRTNETVNLPNDLIALAFARTSLLRMGAFTQHGVWDAGFMGKGEFILAVENPEGIRIKQNARIAQLIFLRMNEIGQGYNGIYQKNKDTKNENQGLRD
ncbi:MAG: deoxyuridine 5'-triphosphate nucleotidohydrolase [Candidatus Omnitrophica bacterium]|nr:deoxyuridine 5'-triphosphate nucleotidohydrolase [Candidatus Omnitrophota bacterium]